MSTLDRIISGAMRSLSLDDRRAVTREVGELRDKIEELEGKLYLLELRHIAANGAEHEALRELANVRETEERWAARVSALAELFDQLHTFTKRRTKSPILDDIIRRRAEWGKL